MTKLKKILSILVTFLTLADYISSSPRHYEPRVIENISDGSLDPDATIYDNLPCPNEEDILPCECYFINGNMGINCNNVTDEEELRAVFQADFPLNNFTAFRMEDNPNIKVIPYGVFNGITFQEFYIRMSSVERIATHAFDDSLETARVINLLSCNITQFPYEMLQKFSNLTSLDLSGNPLTSVPATSFQGITTLIELHLNVIHVDELLPGTFQNLPNLEMLYLNANSLTNIPSGLFKLGSTRSPEIHLYRNKIHTVEPDAFDAMNMLINMDDNDMTEIEENTWRPILEGGAKLDLTRNQLLCGCDVAWLVRNSSLMHRVTSDSYCNDEYGHSIWNLNPDDFVDC